jgi:thiamine-phosphate pyrophosphorylase
MRRQPEIRSGARPVGIEIPRLYAILDAAQVGDAAITSVAEMLLSAGVTLIQYRDKRASSRELYERCRLLLEHIRPAGGTLIVNDRADVARAVDADGVHVGQEDLPVELARRVVGDGKWVGCSTHNPEQVRLADKSAADYIGFGPIFATRSKERPDPVVGLAGLREARRLTDKPIVAIGGITRANARAVFEAGADSVAVIQDLLQAEDIAARAREFLHLLADGEANARTASANLEQ